MSRPVPFHNRRAFAAALVAGVVVGGAARAGDTADGAGGPGVRLASVGIPVFEGNEVVNYLFLSVRINLTLTAPEARFRDMEPYFRDVLVRAAHRTSFGLAGHSDQLDVPRFTAAMTTEFSRLTGPGMIKSVEVLSQSPKRHLS